MTSNHRSHFQTASFQGNGACDNSGAASGARWFPSLVAGAEGRQRTAVLRVSCGEFVRLLHCGDTASQVLLVQISRTFLRSTPSLIRFLLANEACD